MKRVLVIDCTLREQSRTKQLADSFLNGVDCDKCEVKVLKLDDMNLKPMGSESYRQRDVLLAKGKRDHPRFDLAHMTAKADLIVIAAPFWDLSFPSMLKVFIEHICVEGITFNSDETGLHGCCRAEKLVYLTTRGGLIRTGDPMEQATPYLEALRGLLGFGPLTVIAAAGMDVQGYDSQTELKNACVLAEKTAEEIAAAW